MLLPYHHVYDSFSGALLPHGQTFNMLISIYFKYFGDTLVGIHEGGHIPFEFDLPSIDEGYVTVALNNTLTNHTIPQGFLKHHSPNNRFVEKFIFINVFKKIKRLELLCSPK